MGTKNKRGIRMSLQVFWDSIRLGLSTEKTMVLMSSPCKEYELWLHNLPAEPVVGLRGACWAWVRHWGNGGGDYSTEACIHAALDEAQTEIPRELAELMFDNVSGYSKSPFEASVLVMDIVKECLDELRKED